jgi:hypothetical protein
MHTAAKALIILRFCYCVNDFKRKNFGFGCRYHWVLHNRPAQHLLPKLPSQRLGPVGATVWALAAPLRWMMLRQLAFVLALHNRMAGMRPRRNFINDLMAQGLGTVSREYAHSVKCGDIRKRHAAVHHLTESTVEITTDPAQIRTQKAAPKGGETKVAPSQLTTAKKSICSIAATEQLQADVVVLATGFQHTLQPLHSDLSQVRVALPLLAMTHC